MLLLDGIADYAVFMLDATGHVASWNPGGVRIHGYTAKEIIGQHLSVFFTKEDVKEDVATQAAQRLQCHT